MWQNFNAPNEMRPFSYSMEFAVNGKPIPNPSAFSGAESDLDTMGERDATGYLHRNKVATKYPLKLEYSNIPWNALVAICQLMTNESFEFTFPDPFSTNATRTITAYAGDRKFSAVQMSNTRAEYVANLKVSIIEI